MKKSSDFSTIIGVIIAFILIFAAISFGGSAKSFIDVPSVLIVIGGTIAITTACFSFLEIFSLFGIIARTTFYSNPEPMEVGVKLLEYSEDARKNGMLSLQKIIDPDSPKTLLTGIEMLVDGYDVEAVESTLQQNIRSRMGRHGKGASILRKAAEISPAMGLIGTLIGLVQMLGNLDDPASIGPAMAVALLTTLYGAILAYVVFIPLASKLERNSKAELLVDTICAKGISGIGRKENPRKLELEFNAILPPEQRFSYFDDDN